MYRSLRPWSTRPELADVSAYIESLCIPTDHGRYEGADAALQVAKAGPVREAVQGMPRRNRRRRQGQVLPRHRRPAPKYLLRQMTEIRDGHRCNANPDMVKVIKPYTDDQLVAISAYQASLKMPGSMWRQEVSC